LKKREFCFLIYSSKFKHVVKCREVLELISSTIEENAEKKTTLMKFGFEARGIFVRKKLSPYFSLSP
jgi:hypothetical protein